MSPLVRREPCPAAHLAEGSVAGDGEVARAGVGAAAGRARQGGRLNALREAERRRHAQHGDVVVVVAGPGVQADALHVVLRAADVAFRRAGAHQVVLWVGGRPDEAGGMQAATHRVGSLRVRREKVGARRRTRPGSSAWPR